MVVPGLVERVRVTVGGGRRREVGRHYHGLVKAMEELVGAPGEGLQFQALVTCSGEVGQVLEGVEYDGVGAAGCVGSWAWRQRRTLVCHQEQRKERKLKTGRENEMNKKQMSKYTGQSI